MSEYKTLPEMIGHLSNQTALHYKSDGQWKSLSSQDFLESIRRTSLGLRAAGIQSGQTVGILARPSPYWLIADLAIMMCGAVSVPLFALVSEEHFVYQAIASEMQSIFILGQNQWFRVEGHQNLFKKIFTHHVKIELENVMDLQVVMQMGDALAVDHPRLYETMCSHVQEEDLATIIYTSGSTGRPKGVELTQKNIISQLKGARKLFPLDPETDRALSLLPLAHIFERTLMYYYLSSGISIYFADDPKKAVELCQEVRPTVTAVVPLLLERVHGAIASRLHEQNGRKGRIARWAFDLALQDPDELSLLKLTLADLLLYRKLRALLGGELRLLITGGAALSLPLCRFFCNIGIPLYQGYGLTEASPVLATNYPDHNALGTVGLPFPDVQLALGEDDELMARGPNIMRGYHRDPEATCTAIDAQGWLHTGDLAKMDAAGNVTITGRKVDLFKTAAGKFVSPVPIERALTQLPLIDLAMVIGEGRHFVTCLLFPNRDVLRARKTRLGLEKLSDEEFLASEPIRQQLEAHLAAINRHCDQWEQVHGYRFILDALTIEAGHLTPTMKLRRGIVEKKYQQAIDQMYAEAKWVHDHER